VNRQQPADEWATVRDGDGELPEPARAPELAALHLTRPEGTRARDPRHADVDLGERDELPPHVSFDDEEPEEGLSDDDGDTEPDLEDLLESQHYALGDDGQDDQDEQGS
jgi:hypothetical protein